MWLHFFFFRFLGVELENETKLEESRHDPSSGVGRAWGMGRRMCVFDCVSAEGWGGPCPST